MTNTPFVVPPFVPFVVPPAAIASIAAIAVIETQVVHVLKVLEEEIGTLKAQELGYANQADIPEASFGQGSESTQLAKEHTRAHQVIVQSLEKMQTDLADYQTAVQLAKKAIVEADEQAETDLLKLVARTASVNVSSPNPEPVPSPGGSDV